jgi:FKBP-type peptidyl-prolyl cis-trans isomerase SlyD
MRTAQVQAGARVWLRFIFFDAETGEVLDRRHADEPFEYEHGAGEFLRGLERRLEERGAAQGELFDEVLPVEQAYGPHSDQLLQKVKVSELKPGVAEGMVVRLGIPGMEELMPPLLFHITRIHNGLAHLDGNHPMAGRALRCVGEVVKVVMPRRGE